MWYRVFSSRTQQEGSHQHPRGEARAGGMAQVIVLGPKFKPQYCQKPPQNKNKKTPKHPKERGHRKNQAC
jgi:hypothetical protein